MYTLKMSYYKFITIIMIKITMMYIIYSCNLEKAFKSSYKCILLTEH